MAHARPSGRDVPRLSSSLKAPGGPRPASLRSRGHTVPRAEQAATNYQQQHLEVLEPQKGKPAPGQAKPAKASEPSPGTADREPRRASGPCLLKRSADLKSQKAAGLPGGRPAADPLQPGCTPLPQGTFSSFQCSTASRMKESGLLRRARRTATPLRASGSSSSAAFSRADSGCATQPHSCTGQGEAGSTTQALRELQHCQSVLQCKVCLASRPPLQPGPLQHSQRHQASPDTAGDPLLGNRRACQGCSLAREGSAPAQATRAPPLPHLLENSMLARGPPAGNLVLYGRGEVDAAALDWRRKPGGGSNPTLGQESEKVPTGCPTQCYSHAGRKSNSPPQHLTEAPPSSGPPAQLRQSHRGQRGQSSSQSSPQRSGLNSTVAKEA